MYGGRERNNKNGRAFTTIGTSGVVYAHTNTPVIDNAGRTHTFCSAVPNEWHIMGVTQAAGLSLKWFRENFTTALSYANIDEVAKKFLSGRKNFCICLILWESALLT